MHSLTFKNQIQYPDDDKGINIDIVISTNQEIYNNVPAKLDTGSTFCVFQRRFAEAIKLNVEDGQRESICIAKGNFTAFGHEVNLRCLDMEWTTVYFAQDESFPVM